MSRVGRWALRRDLVAPIGVTLLGAVLLARLGTGRELSRDEAVYAYAGQRLAHGVPPYAGIFDPKGPVPTLLAGLGAAVASLTGHPELLGIRLVYGVTACVGVLTVYLLARTVWDSRLAGVVAALTLCCLPVYAGDAFSGPDAKTPVVALVAASLWLALTRRWFLAGCVSALAVLTWQPLVVVPVVVLVGALRGRADRPDDARAAAFRALAGQGVVLLAGLLLFVVTGTVHRAFDAGVWFPLTGIKHAQTSTFARVEALVRSIFTDGPGRGLLWCLGTAAFVWLVVTALRSRRTPGAGRLRDPLVWLLVAPAVGLFLYCLVDYQGGPDLIPLLAFPALGVGGAVDLLARRWIAGSRRTTASVAAVVVLTVAAVALPTGSSRDLVCQRARARELAAAVAPGSTMWAFGDPAPLVLTQRANPDRFVYLASGMAEWRARHTPGGLPAWEAEIRRVAPSVAVFGGYDQGDIYRSLVSVFTSGGYSVHTLGKWQVYLAHGVTLRAALPARCGR